MAVRLSPAEVVPHVLDAGVQHGSPVKAGRVEESLVGEELGPVEHVAAGEQRHNVGHYLVPPPAVHPGVRPKGALVSILNQKGYVEYLKTKEYSSLWP